MRCYASTVYAVLCVHLSVCPSVTRWYCIQTAKQTTSYDSPQSLVFLSQKPRRNSDGVTPNAGAKRGG